MYHSITFGTKNTWTDWHIVPSSRPVVATPSPKENYIEIPGGDGSLDLTEVLTGHPTFSDREGSFEFMVMNGYQTWDVLYSTILNYLHGRRMKMILEDDPNYYYYGRFKVDEWNSDKDWSRIVIAYTVEPFKYAVNETVKDVTVVSGTPYELNVGVIEKSIIPVFNVAAGSSITATYKGTGYALAAGSSSPFALTDIGVANTVYFTGSGSLQMTYRLGKL